MSAGGTRANALLALASVSLFVLLTEGVLLVAGFAYEPYADEFEITPEYEIFEREGDAWVTRPRKRGSFREQRFAAAKGPDEVRVFLLGGSSVHNLGDAPALRAALADALPPEARLTLVNAGGRGYGSTRLRLHFQELLAHAPDLVVLYSGHNEFNETYLRDTLYDESAATRLNRALLARSRLYQLLSLGIHRATQANLEALREKRHPFFPADFELQWDEVYDKDERHAVYEENLTAMARSAREHGVPLLLATVAYNRRAPPFKAAPDDPWHACARRERNGATEAFRACAEAAIAAGSHPIRATRATNAVVERVAARRGLPLADVDAAVIAASPGGVPGFELFDDHCHLNERGNALLERVLADAIAAHGLLDAGP